MRVLTAAEQELTARRCHAEWAAEQGTGVLGAAVRAGKMIVASAALATAVQELLSEREHIVEVGTAVTDPRCPQTGRVVTLELSWAGREAAVPITPGGTTLRIWAGHHGGSHGRITDLDEVLAELTVPAAVPAAGPDGWVPAATLAEMLVGTENVGSHS